ncbi:unnamed protein product [Didymodactylos carnosus]|uniref:Receptor ligand binding region domain-containing protein n=1 Tax=Didymodactylos carnosus TaxID=1234261 RepID=A0A815Y9S7_9BILA|nr:unnamed protein product [Didymodactylos carnosus]CAF1567102.1 unnamed protein product [Didymodactylos carnosus]CAF4276257.1 unnamed protein product [Didymodactylos carnosus]CAF4429448.1 unnamed protein product [Didymodactylos carnosus]
MQNGVENKCSKTQLKPTKISAPTTPPKSTPTPTPTPPKESPTPELELPSHDVVPYRGNVINTLDFTCKAVKSQSNIAGITGPFLSNEAKIIAQFSSRIGISTISYSATDPELSDRNAYPMFYRLAPADNIAAYAISKIFEKFKWNITNIIYQTDSYGQGGLQASTEIFIRIGVKILSTTKFDMSAKEVDGP